MLLLKNTQEHVSKALGEEDFEAAMTALSALRQPVDTFFNAVLVNDENAAVRANRLALLNEIRKTIHLVADFNKIEG